MRNSSRIVILGVLLAAVFGGVLYLNNQPSPIITSNGRAVAITDDVYAVYVDVENVGAADFITGVTSQEASETSFMGVPADLTLAIPEKSKANFASDGAHIMLRTIGGPPEDGTLISLSLDFQNAGRVPVKAVVGELPTLDIDEDNQSAPEGIIDHSLHHMAPPLIIDDPEDAPSLELTVNENSEGGYELELATTNFQFVELIEEPTTHKEGEGHGHLYLNGLKLQRLYTDRATIGRLPAGTHRISVTLNTNDHRAYATGGKAVASSIDVIVD